MQSRRPKRDSFTFWRDEDDDDDDLPMASLRRPGRDSPQDDFDVVAFLDDAIQLAENKRDDVEVDAQLQQLRDLRDRWTENSDNVLPKVVELLNASKYEAETSAHMHKMWMRVIGQVQDRSFKSMAQRQGEERTSRGSDDIGENETAMKQLKLVHLTIELEAQQARSDFIRTRLQELHGEVTALDREHDETEKRTDAIQREIARLESRDY